MRRADTPINVVVYDKDGPDRWLVGAFFRSLEREAIVEETTELSDLKKSLEGGKTGLVVVSDDGSEECRFWLKHLAEGQTAPVIVLIDEAESELLQILEQGPVAALAKNAMARDELLQAFETAMGKWGAIKRGETHKSELDKFANRDGLTGILNRRSAMSKVEECVARARRYGEFLSVLLLDVDSMGNVNTAYGRPFGDNVLVRLATLLEKRTRDVDIRGRYGGDEFILALPHTDMHSARIVAERVRGFVEGMSFSGTEKELSITVSGGLAGYEAADDVGTLAYRAERNLCKAKESGRNKVC